jgi:dTDP-4-dehydrorhamnose reductase
MKVLVTGASGQLGRALLACAPSDMEVIAATRNDLDIGDSPAVANVLRAEQPDVVVNCAAFTAVDLAESQLDQAETVNAQGPANICEAVLDSGTRVVHVSTDYVFDGRQSHPYGVSDPTNPLSQYGRSKLAGERAVLSMLPERSVVLRTSWLYGAHAKNFVTTVLRHLSAGTDMRIVADQIGAPTWAGSAARALWSCVRREALSGIVHWTDAGVASWYDLAQAVLEEAVSLEMLAPGPTVAPIPTSEYPTAAVRPSFSVLEIWHSSELLQLQPVYWRETLRQMLTEHRDG